METIRLKGLTKYAKERIKQHGRGEHGDTFILEKREPGRVLVRSMEKSWKLKPGVPDTWAGWLWTEPRCSSAEVEEISDGKA